MEKLGLHEIRKEFLDFFRKKDHLIAKSYSLVPNNDKSLLLINAGMAPLKPYFLGTEESPSKRMATSQKCVRTGDIENVGKTARHGTFFEMLGNFSFGDYFKRESIKWAWEFLTEKLKLEKKTLWISVYLDDDDAFEIWEKEIGVPKEKIVRLGKEDNFWELEVGPCGPCSEIYVDRGEKYGCNNPDCKPGCDCDRYMEIWNLVFSEYDKDKNGNYNLLNSPNIDTGMGLERISTIMQGVENIFEIDVMKAMIIWIENRSNKKYVSDSSEGISFRVIVDHIRAITFLISDGVVPSNEGRGYVLRRLIRRAARHGKLLGIDDLFLSLLAKEVISSWKTEYDELEKKESIIVEIIENEELKFQETIDSGMDRLENYIDEMKKNKLEILSGERAFKLYDTFGFPLDLTKEILEEKGYGLEEKNFNIEMEKQRERARKARSAKDTLGWSDLDTVEIDNSIDTEFVGYFELETESKSKAIYYLGKEVDSIDAGKEGILILDKTPFYPEGGGQTGDIGILKKDSLVIEVLGTMKNNRGTIIHNIKVKEGILSKDQMLKALVSEKERTGSARNHTATHILHQALKDVLGNNVNQAGSFVTSDKLRFDFTYGKGLKELEIEKIEDIVNEKILERLKVEVIETTLEKAKDIGAQALFGEKYSESVRVVKVGEYSKELCGGTHLNNSSEIGMFKILSETGIASGVRRIEALTGLASYNYIKKEELILKNVQEVLKSDRNSLVLKAEQLNQSVKNKEKELEEIKSNLALSGINDIIKNKETVDGINVVRAVVEDTDSDSLRKLADNIKNKLESVVVVLASKEEEKIIFVSMTSKDLVQKGIHSGNILKEIAKITKGGGGGRPDMAQAGGKDFSKLEEAMNNVDYIIKSQIK